MDFVSDQTSSDIKFRTLTIIDVFTREGLAIEPGQSLRGEDVVRVLTGLSTTCPLMFLLIIGRHRVRKSQRAWGKKRGPLTKGKSPICNGYLFGGKVTGEDQASFLIGKHEVTNEDFAEFVNANGYTDPQLWLDRFEDEDRELDFDAAMQRFTDRTGRQGPAAWEYGTYPDGRGDYPVLGISWFEARAYARFRGADLPTLHQFTTAAYSPVEVNAPIRPFVIPQSQFSSADSRPVLQSQAMGPYGAYDLTGNAREWVINSTQDTAIRYTLGGSWKDPNYTSTMPFRAKAWDRSEANGMRLVFNDSAPSERARAPISSALGDYDFNDHPLDDPERFNDVLWQFEAPAIPLKTELIPHAAAEEEGFKVLSFAVGDGRERMLIAIQLPTHGTPPYQPVIYFPGHSHFGPGFEFERDFAKQFPAPSYVVKGGRALIYAEYYGSYGRYDSFYLQPVEDRSALVLKRRMRWVEEVGRIIDYLETDKQIDASKVAYLGASFGATFPLPVLALEKRLKAAVLVVGGFSASDTGRDRSPIANITNYVSRITLPTLMLNGRFDYLYKEHHQVRPLFNLIATPEAHKRLVMYDSGHWPLPENQMISEVLTWLDTYLGPVNTQAAAIVEKERPDS